MWGKSTLISLSFNDFCPYPTENLSCSWAVTIQTVRQLTVGLLWHMVTSHNVVSLKMPHHQCSCIVCQHLVLGCGTTCLVIVFNVLNLFCYFVLVLFNSIVDKLFFLLLCSSLWSSLSSTPFLSFLTVLDIEPLELQQINASSYRISGNRRPEYGILDSNSFWAPSVDQPYQSHWFQVELSALAGITGIRTQGAGIRGQWAKKLFVYAGNDENSLMPIMEGGRAKVQ